MKRWLVWLGAAALLSACAGIPAPAGPGEPAASAPDEAAFLGYHGPAHRHNRLYGN
ncbi:hypothetical protein [Ramlibacter tataouinensis]|uniref:hypothetical protein n=1 Tax=Ramlibacter tataouinensis TaxID=94132 RepID=UPI00030C882B|nr:hypothetical protein [Ramlibacter tataouinensis]